MNVTISKNKIYSIRILYVFLFIFNKLKENNLIIKFNQRLRQAIIEVGHIISLLVNY